MEQYTGRKIGIFTDAHALLEPTVAVLIDMKEKGVEEIYSLGDNIGVGPNPSEVIYLLRNYNVTSIAGNSEEYCTLGIQPFAFYFDNLKNQSQLWTLSKLNEEQIGLISLFPRSIELVIGGKKIALCHFANDVRFDFINRDSWTYQKYVRNGLPGYEQFLYTNSPEQQKEIDSNIEKYGKDAPYMKGIVSAKEDPLFTGKRVDQFDSVFQGHVHWKLYEESNSTRFYSIRAVGIGYDNDNKDLASYVLLKEKENGGYDFEEVLVPYDREKMIYNILKSDSPDRTIERFASIRR